MCHKMEIFYKQNFKKNWEKQKLSFLKIFENGPFCSFSFQFSMVSCIRKQIDNGNINNPLSICFLIQETTGNCNENEQKGPETKERV